MSDPFTFLTFGCWNNLNTDNTGLEIVMAKLKTEIQGMGGIDQIIVSGDNYYPEKTKTITNDVEIKQKKLFIKNLKAGLQKLQEASGDVPVTMILGNHDLEPNGKMVVEDEDEDEDEEPKIVSPCLILSHEIANKGNIKYELFGKVDTSDITDTVILLIDTSLYAEKEEVDKYVPCYNVWSKNNNYNDESIIETLQTNQETFILKNIEGVKNIILIGHHPIKYIKNKKKDSKTVESNGLDDLIKKINAENSNANMYYICADKHYYQHSTITFDNFAVEQYIVGTGGAELDDLPVLQGETPFSFGGGSMKIYDDQQKVNGFVKVSLSQGSTPSFTFITAAIPVGGKRRKNKLSRRYKSKKRVKQLKTRNKSKKQRKKKHTLRRV